MSLTSILRDKNSQELRDQFKSQFSKPPFFLESEIKALPCANNYTAVGSAFDYLMRFYLMRLNSGKTIPGDSWVADRAYSRLASRLRISKKSEIIAGFNLDKVYDRKKLLILLTSQYNDSKGNFEKFLTDGQFTDKLIKSAMFLAKLDVYWRSGLIDKGFDYHDPDDLNDLEELVLHIDDSKFCAEKACYINPTFGIGSRLVGEADADIIIDNTLIDIKTTQYLKLTRQDLNQLLGYYILSLIGGVNGKKRDTPIENIGIYFARFGELWTFPLSILGSNQKFFEFKKWFVEYIEKKRDLSKSN